MEPPRTFLLAKMSTILRKSSSATFFYIIDRSQVELQISKLNHQLRIGDVQVMFFNEIEVLDDFLVRIVYFLDEIGRLKLFMFRICCLKNQSYSKSRRLYKCILFILLSFCDDKCLLISWNPVARSFSSQHIELVALKQRFLLAL